MQTLLLKGIPASPGIATGSAFLLMEEELVIPNYLSSFELEEARLGQALQKYKLELSALLAKTPVAEAHLKKMLERLEDSELLKKTLLKIRQESVNAEYALDWAAKEIEKDNTMGDLTSWLLHYLLKKIKNPLEALTSPVILVARDLTSLSIAAISSERKKIGGLITELGDQSSYAAMIASAFDLPAVVGLQQRAALIQAHDLLALNGTTGEVLVNPGQAELEKIKA